MGSFQQPADKIVGQRIGKKLVANITSRMNGPVDGVLLMLGKGRSPDEKLVRIVVHRNPHNAQPPAVRAGSVYLARPVF